MRNDLDKLNYHGRYVQVHRNAADLDLTLPLIVFQPPNARYIQGVSSLVDFGHPRSAIYLFGGDNSNLNDEDDLGGRLPDDIVYVPQTGKDQMYSWVAAAVVFYDRLVKLG